MADESAVVATERTPKKDKQPFCNGEADESVLMAVERTPPSAEGNIAKRTTPTKRLMSGNSSARAKQGRCNPSMSHERSRCQFLVRIGRPGVGSSKAFRYSAGDDKSMEEARAGSVEMLAKLRNA